MRRATAIFLIFLLAFHAAHASDAPNPFFGKYRRQFAFSLGQGVNSGFLIAAPNRPVPFNMLHFQYSQPTTFFGFPARETINAIQLIGWGRRYGWNWPAYSMPMAMLSEDIAFIHTKKWYFGSGFGAGFQAKQNERVGSKFLFGFKLFAGYQMWQRTNLEVFMQHFSNGNTGYSNNSYAFYGLGIAYNF